MMKYRHGHGHKYKENKSFKIELNILFVNTGLLRSVIRVRVE